MLAISLHHWFTYPLRWLRSSTVKVLTHLWWPYWLATFILGNYLEFRLKSNCPSLVFFSPEAEHTNGIFIHMMGFEHNNTISKKHWQNSTLYIISCFPSVIAWLGAVACCCCPASQESILWHIPSLGKDQNSKLHCLLYVHCFCTTVKLEKS